MIYITQTKKTFYDILGKLSPSPWWEKQLKVDLHAMHSAMARVNQHPHWYLYLFE
jgi:hypothetical protein